jgi:hypothetical protein
MSAVFRELELSWGGQTYRVKPTMGLLNRIEQDVSLSSVAYRIGQGQPPVSQLALIISAFLAEAGCKASPEDVYAELMLGDAEQFRAMAEAVLLATFPQRGKVEAPAKAVRLRK